MQGGVASSTAVKAGSRTAVLISVEIVMFYRLKLEGGVRSAKIEKNGGFYLFSLSGMRFPKQ